MNFLQLLNRRPYLIAIAMSLALVFWMSGGKRDESVEQASTETNNLSTSLKTAEPASVKTKVKAEHRVATEVSRSVVLHGRTEPGRAVTLKAETAGRVVAIGKARGALVKRGDMILRLSMQNRQQQLIKSKALLKQRQLEYKGATKLSQKGYQAELQVAQALAQLEEAKMELAGLRIDIANTVIKAPFDGVLNDRQVEIGDFVGIGSELAHIIDSNPLIVAADAAESQVADLHIGQQGTAVLLKGVTLSGTIRFIAKVADQATHTFKVEMAITNPNLAVATGVSGTMRIPIQKVLAHKVSPALLTLDSAGNLGVKIIKHNNIVEFRAIDVVRSDPSGIWLAGLGEYVDIITSGQGFVRAGDQVEPHYLAENTADNVMQSTAGKISAAE